MIVGFTKQPRVTVRFAAGEHRGALGPVEETEHRSCWSFVITGPISMSSLVAGSPTLIALDRRDERLEQRVVDLRTRR